MTTSPQQHWQLYYVTSTTLTIVLRHLNNIDNCTTSPQQHRQLYYITSTTSTIILRHLNNIDNHTTLNIRITPKLLCHLDNINNHIPLNIRIMPEQLTYDTTTNKLYKLSTYTAKGTLLPSPPISLTHSLSILVSAVSYHAHILTRYIRFPFWASAWKPQSSVGWPPATLPVCRQGKKGGKSWA